MNIFNLKYLTDVCRQRATARFYCYAIVEILVAMITASQLNAGEIPKKWEINLPSKSCPWSATDFSCHYGSPVVADLDRDGVADIIAVTNNGHILAVKSSGQILFDVDVAPFFGMAANSEEIGSSPTVADLDGDGFLEIAVGVGSIYPSRCTAGGVVVLTHDGKIFPGWPKISDDWTPPMGCTDSVFGTPAIGDLDNDGKKEIVVGGFDMRIYAWRSNGALMAGFPINSAHAIRFPNEPELKTRIADTIWSSPALGDIDRDGFLDIVIGTDEGNRPPGWSCPYPLPAGWRPDYCGGSLYVINRFGKLLQGFPKYVWDTISSTPALYDMNSDGWLEIVVGTGTFYHENSTSHPTLGYKVYVWDHLGNDVPGWLGGKDVGGATPASPAIGDIDGDGTAEIVIATFEPEKKVYAWHTNGVLLPGFPMKPVTERGDSLASFNTPASFVLADYDGNGSMEIFLSEAWGICVVNGAGQQITGSSYPTPAPLYLTSGSIINNPVVADIDNDGKLELVAANHKLTAWDLPLSTNSKADWPMFKGNAARSSAAGIQPKAIEYKYKTLLPLIVK